MRDTAAIILAAGQGKRLRSSLPKVLHPLAGRKVIDYSIDLVRALGIAKIVVVIPANPTPIRSYLEAHHPTLDLVIQDPPRGTGHAVRCAQKVLKGFRGDSLILCGDMPLMRRESLRAFRREHLKRKADLSLMTSFLEDPTGYGRILRNSDGRLTAIREERDASPQEKAIREANCGIYWVKTQILFKGLSSIAPTNAQREYYLTDLPGVLLGKKMSVHTWTLPNAEETHGINTRAHLARAHAILYKRAAEQWMARGVSIADPNTTYIEPGVTLEPDCTLEPQCHLRGKTRIGKGARIGVGSVIRDCEIGAGAEILPYSVLSESRLEADVHVGPFAHLRPDSHLKKGAKVGNFVEMKKTVLGERAKANHLSYLGDTTVGADANIGAGTITCNYDGQKKSRTEIGAGAFIGSNSSLIAPVAIGRGSVIGAGSAISKDVPAEALGITRAPQRVIQNWSMRRKQRGVS